MSDHVAKIATSTFVEPKHPAARAQVSKSVRFVENIIFNVRWFLVPFYLGLVAVLVYYGVAFFKEISAFLVVGSSASSDEVEVFALNTIDIVMIANLLKMIIAGSYNSFISKAHGYTNENISSGELKIKIATSVVVLCMIHMLKTFIKPAILNDTMVIQSILFVLFLVAALVLSKIEALHNKQEHK